jgi:hypothetical protein
MNRVPRSRTVSPDLISLAFSTVIIVLLASPFRAGEAGKGKYKIDAEQIIPQTALFLAFGDIELTDEDGV